MFNRLSLRRRQQLWAYVFILVPLLFFLFIRIGPTLFAFNVSVREWNILSPEKPFVGATNSPQLPTPTTNHVAFPKFCLATTKCILEQAITFSFQDATDDQAVRKRCPAFYLFRNNVDLPPPHAL